MTINLLLRSFCALLLLPAALRAQQPGCDRVADSATVTRLGAYSNMTYTEEHAYGYTVQLWRAGSCLIGLFYASAGLTGNTPTGRLIVSRYDRGRGRLGFTAKLSTGVVLDPKSRTEVPSREEFQFEGSLKPKLLQGKLDRFDRLRPGSAPTSESVSLEARPEETESMIQARSYRDWKQSVEEVLRFRGPRW
jgi:hypothetical protein